MMTRLLSALLLLVSGPVVAGETPWEQVMPDVAIRVIAADTVGAEGSTWIAIEIDMPETIKTYWRVPGESGIPPQLDFSGSNDIGGYEVAWPFPVRSETASYLDHAYYGHTVLPIALEVIGDAPVVRLNAVLGICSDICVPVSVAFALPIDTETPDRSNALRITQARAEVPILWEGPEYLGDMRFDAATGSLVVQASADFPHNTAIADVAGKMWLFGPPERDAASATLRFPLLGRMPADIGDGEVVHVTFMDQDGAYELIRPLRIEPAG